MDDVQFVKYMGLWLKFVEEMIRWKKINHIFAVLLAIYMCVYMYMITNNCSRLSPGKIINILHPTLHNSINQSYLHTLISKTTKDTTITSRS
jgi:hypothetical protein